MNGRGNIVRKGAAQNLIQERGSQLNRVRSNACLMIFLTEACACSETLLMTLVSLHIGQLARSPAVDKLPRARHGQLSTNPV